MSTPLRSIWAGFGPSCVCRPETSFQHLQRDIYGMISDAKTLFLGVVSFANFAPKGRLTRKLTYTVKRAAPMQAFMGAVPIVVGDPLRELFADVGRLESAASQNSSNTVRCTRSTLPFSCGERGGIGRNRMASSISRR